MAAIGITTLFVVGWLACSKWLQTGQRVETRQRVITRKKQSLQTPEAERINYIKEVLLPYLVRGIQWMHPKHTLKVDLKRAGYFLKPFREKFN